MAYSIDVVGANLLLTDVTNLVVETLEIRDGMQKQFSSLRELLTDCPDVQAELDFAEEYVLLEDMQTTTARCNNAVRAVQDAINAYVQADDEMESAARAAMGRGGRSVAVS